MHRIAIFASGAGTNAQRIIEHFNRHPSIQVSLVLSNKADAPVLEKAQKAGVETFIFNRGEFYESNLVLKELQSRNIDLIVLAGFMWLVPEYLINAFSDRMINVHPALLPKFGGKGMYGMHVHQAVKVAGETETGITIHLVNEEYDKGRILFQAKCALSKKDSADDIAKKVHMLEYANFPSVIEQFILTA
ncbi:MAG: phosphoribosylglycinamide formyltransferase [Bacteroidota bacterium]|jgi:phosphoribosylglycinamide formyltransferase-1